MTGLEYREGVRSQGGREKTKRFPCQNKKEREKAF